MFEDHKFKKQLRAAGRELENEQFLMSLRSDLEEHIRQNPANEEVQVEKRNVISEVVRIISGKMKDFPFGSLKTNPKFVRVAAVSLLVVFAGTGIALASQESLPGDSLYSIKLLTEDLRYSVSFNSETKAKLHASFAAERVSEIKEILSKKGVEPKGLDQAISRLQYNTSKAADAISDKKKETDAEDLARNINSAFNEQKKELEETFKSQADSLKDQESAIKEQMRETKKTGDEENLQKLEGELNGIKDERKNLVIRRNESFQAINDEKKVIKDNMDEKDKIEESNKEISEDIAGLAEEKENIIKNSSEKGIVLAQDTFGSFDGFMSKAQGALNDGRYGDAEMFVENAKIELEAADGVVEKIMENSDNENYNRVDENNNEEIRKETSGEREDRVPEQSRDGEQRD
ncbi:MAG: DUF5667 domain-containing protein [Candidatus Paceibacterota bacterium]|jgi:hypothetical protein